LRTSATSIFTARRVASTIVLPGVFAGMLVFASPASAATPSPTTGICNGVVNQASHRGDVQANLLTAAARKNAELIAKLQADKAALELTQTSLKGQIASAEREVAALDAANVELDKQIAAGTTELASLTTQRESTAKAITAGLHLGALRAHRGSRRWRAGCGGLWSAPPVGRTLLGVRSGSTPDSSVVLASL